MSLRSARTTTLGALTYGLIGLGAFAQPAPSGEPIVVGQRFELRSVRMNEPRTFLVHRADLNADVFWRRTTVPACS